MKKIWFILVTQGRTGSCLLSTSLQQRHDVYMHEEILHPFCHTKLPFEDGRRRVLAAYNNCPATCDAIGCKIHVTQPSKKYPHWENGWRVIEDHEDIKVISMSRRDTLAQLASMKIATMTGKWVDQSTIKERPTVYIHPNELYYFNEYQRGMQQARLGAIDPKRIYSVHYEDLISNWTNITKQILEFLGLPTEPELNQILKKQELRPLSEIIENYSDFNRE